MSPIPIRRHTCGGDTTSAQCAACVAEDHAQQQASRLLGLSIDEVRRMPDDCRECADEDAAKAATNWPYEIALRHADGLLARYRCRGCGAIYSCWWGTVQVFPPGRTQPARSKKQGIPRWLAKQVMERDAYRCQEPTCGTHIDLTVDHIIPESLGGPTELDNLQTLCRPCNSRKGVKVG